MDEIITIQNLGIKQELFAPFISPNFTNLTTIFGDKSIRLWDVKT